MGARPLKLLSRPTDSYTGPPLGVDESALAQLATLLRSAPGDGPSVSAAVVAAAVDARVAGLTRVAAAPTGRESWASDIADACRTITAQHLGKLAAVSRAGTCLDRAGVPWAVVKGPVLAELAYAGVPRPYEDVDLLVAPSRFSDAIRALEEGIDAVILDRNWPLLARQDRAELHALDRMGQSFDVHWHLVNIGWMRQGPKIDTDEVLERRQLDDRVGAPVLDATDRFWHCALHGLISGGDQLIWMADLMCAIRNDPPDWDELVTRSRRQAIALPVAVMLARTEEAIGASPPAGVIESLASRSWNPGLLHWLARWRPGGGHLPGGGSVSGAVTRSLSDQVLRSSLNVGRLATEMLRRQVDRSPHWADPEDPANVLYDAGGAAGRQWYLNAVPGHDRWGHRSMAAGVKSRRPPTNAR